MTLKYLFIPLAASALLSLGSCDKIDQKDRLKPGEEQSTPEPTEAGHIVLVEDYTGQECPNCPIFGAKIGSIAKKYPGKIIPVAIHCGILGIAGSDFTTKAGEAYGQWLGLNAVPVGVVDRKVANGKTQTFDGNSVNQMVSAIELAVREPARMSLFAKAAFNADSTRVSVEILGNASEKTPLTTDAKNLMVQIWLLENNVKGEQHLPGGKTEKNFVHQHLLRAVINGEWGEAFVLGKTYKTGAAVPTFAQGKKNLHVVSFVYDKTNRTVIETIETEIK